MYSITKRLISVLLLALLLVMAAVPAFAADFGYAGEAGTIVIAEDSKAGLAEGKTLQLQVEGAAIVSAVSKKTKVATVDDSGLITAKKAGKTKITVTTDTGVSYVLDLTVVSPKKPDSLVFKKKKYSTFAGMKADLSDYLKAKPYADILDKKSIKWTSSNEKVVTVKKGKITAQGAGTAVVTATAKNGKSASITVNVKRNKIDNLHDVPKLSAVRYGQEIYLKSVEIVNPKRVDLEYYLLFTHYSFCKTTHFDYIDSKVWFWDAENGSVYLVDGEVRNVKVSTWGMTVKPFKITFTGSAVKNTNVKLSTMKNSIRSSRSFYLFYDIY